MKTLEAFRTEQLFNKPEPLVLATAEVEHVSIPVYRLGYSGTPMRKVAKFARAYFGKPEAVTLHEGSNPKDVHPELSLRKYVDIPQNALAAELLKQMQESAVAKTAQQDEKAKK